MNPIIEIKNIGKKYDIAHQRGGYVALRDVLTNIAKSPFQFAKHKIKRAVGMETKEEFWALRNIDLKINKGDIVGVIGHNGAGKSTLLKILTGITPPTEGEIIMHGKVASLLEVGTGFHPELTGRENIFLNGAILGMTKKEIVKKFDEIVAFSGIEKFLDTPVKYYSSGMYVRLAFSVAAHMEPDILLVDEVLAVGDAEFQKKCLGKMEEITGQSGRTILFVSHNMSAIQRLCKKTVLIEKGAVKKIGDTKDVISEYLHEGQSTGLVEFTKNKNKDVQILSVETRNDKNKTTSTFSHDENFSIDLSYHVNKDLQNTIVTLEFFAQDGQMFFFSADSDNAKKILDKKSGTYEVTIPIAKNFLNPGSYYLRFSIQSPGQIVYDIQGGIPLKITERTEDLRGRYYNGTYLGYHGMLLNWETKSLND